MEPDRAPGQPDDEQDGRMRGRMAGPVARRSVPPLGRVLAVAAVIAGLLVPMALLGSAPAGAGSGVRVSAVVGGQALSRSTDSHATKLDPTKPATIAVTVTNSGSSAVSVRTVRLDGRVLDLSFFAYDTAVVMDVAPGATDTLRFPLDLTGLDGQATGLLPGSLTLLDARHHAVASQSFVADVQGSLWSVYGLFGLALLILTGLSFGTLMIALARHRLPANRWQRALRFLTPGIGVGLVVTFFLSAVRVFVPRFGSWVIFAVVFAAVFFVIGYLSPAPDAEGESGDIDEGLALEADGTVTAPSGSGR